MNDKKPATLVVTYCCRDKDPSPDPLPARDRYLSSRIRAAEEAATRLDFPFRILSGLYGLLEAEQPLADYDHLLTFDQVADHAEKLGNQLRGLNVVRVIFVTRTLEEDPATEPYRETMALACKDIQVEMETVEIKKGDPSVSELVSLLWGPGRYRQPH